MCAVAIIRILSIFVISLPHLVLGCAALSSPRAILIILYCCFIILQYLPLLTIMVQFMGISCLKIEHAMPHIACTITVNECDKCHEYFVQMVSHDPVADGTR